MDTETVVVIDVDESSIDTIGEEFGNDDGGG